jgi:uncharacterized protein
MSIWPSFKEQRVFAYLLTTLMSLTVLLLVVAAISLLNINREVNYYENTITVEGEATIEQAPTKATVNFSVETQEDDSEDAQDENDDILEQIFDELKEVIDASSIQTENYSLYENERWNPATREYETDGWVVRQDIEVSIDNVDDVAEIIGLVTRGGATNVNGPYYEADDSVDMEAEARLEAIEEALAEAESIAEALGKKLGRMIDYSEYSYGDDDWYYEGYDYARSTGGVIAESDAITIQPGMEETTFYVNITYKLR